MNSTLRKHLDTGFVAPFDRAWCSIAAPMKKINFVGGFSRLAAL
jgi:hypothetical protein